MACVKIGMQSPPPGIPQSKDAIKSLKTTADERAPARSQLEKTKQNEKRNTSK